jgi:hypothetical protein
MFKKEDVEQFLEAIGGKSEVCRKIECTRPALDKWLKDKEIPEFCARGISFGAQWHKRIKKLGFNPKTLKPL